MELIVITNEIIKKACDFISADLNIYLTHDQMVSLLSTDSELLDQIHDFGIDNDIVKEEIHNHFCRSLIGKTSPCQPDEDWSELPDSVIESFMVNLQNAAFDKGYRYSTHPDGPDADEFLN
jgi:hypothetical protein